MLGCRLVWDTLGTLTVYPTSHYTIKALNRTEVYFSDLVKMAVFCNFEKNAGSFLYIFSAIPTMLPSSRWFKMNHHYTHNPYSRKEKSRREGYAFPFKNKT